MKTVSVIIPTFRRPTMLARAIDSVLAQTHSPIEIIVVDDNNPDSTDRRETEDVMLSYSGCPNVTYIKHDANKGGSAARNTGWKNAKGEYITFLDDDDEIAPDKLSEQIGCLESLDDEWGACYTAYHIVMPNGRIQHSSTNQRGDVYLRALMRTLYMGSGSNVLYRKSVVDKVDGYDESFKRNQDIEFMVRCFEVCKVAFVDKDLLTVHFEVRETKRSFEFIDGVTAYYLEKFASRINALNSYDKHRVLAVITLDRARIAFKKGERKYALNLIRTNDVHLSEVIRYLFYLANRAVTGKSYGFYLN